MRPDDRLAGRDMDLDKGLRADGAGHGEEVVAKNGAIAGDVHRQAGPAVADGNLIVGDASGKTGKHGEDRILERPPEAEAISLQDRVAVVPESRSGGTEPVMAYANG